MEYLKNKRIYDWKISKNRLLTSFWHHPWQKAPAGCAGNGSTVYYRRIIWKPRKVTRNRNFPGLLRHHDIKKRAVTSFVFGLDEWHQIGFILGGRGSTESFQPWHEFLLLIGVQMGVCPHDNRNSIPDPLGHQNNRVPKFDTERNVAVPKIVDTNVRQIGYLGAAGQFFVKGCTGHVKYPVIWGQAV